MRHDDAGRAGRRTPDPIPRRSGRSAKAVRAGSLAAATLLLAGCATSQEVRYGEITSLSAAYPVQTAGIPEAEQPLSIGDLIVGLRAGQAQEELVQAVRTRGLRAVASAADIDLLLEAGAGPELIDAVHAVSAGIAAAAAPPPEEAGPYGTIPATPPATVVTPPVYVAPPLYSPYSYSYPYYPGYYGYPYVPWATFGFSWQHYARPRRIEPPRRPARPDRPHARPPYGQTPHVRPPDPPQPQTRPPRVRPPQVRPPDARQPGSRPGFVPRADGGPGSAEPRSQDNGRRWSTNRPGLRPDEGSPGTPGVGTPGLWRSGPSSSQPSSGAGPSRSYSAPSQHGQGRSRR